MVIMINVLEFRQFGWPCGYELPWMPHTAGSNHLSFGLCTIAYFCQRTTSAVAFIINMHGYKVLLYIDDFAGVDSKSFRDEAFDTLTWILQELGLPIAENKNTTAKFLCHLVWHHI